MISTSNFRVELATLDGNQPQLRFDGEDPQALKEWARSSKLFLDGPKKVSEVNGAFVRLFDWLRCFLFVVLVANDFVLSQPHSLATISHFPETLCLRSVELLRVGHPGRSRRACGSGREFYTGRACANIQAATETCRGGWLRRGR